MMTKYKCRYCGRDFRDTPTLVKLAVEMDGHTDHICMRCLFERHERGLG